VIRRVGTVAILLGALLTVLVGGAVLWSVPATWDDYPSWAPALAVTGIAAVVSGAGCIWLAAPDVLRGALSRRAERWTWVATLALAALSVATVWFAGFALLCPIATLVAVRMARGPRWRLRQGPVAGAGPALDE
jgi:hypothetical protein